MGAKRLLVAFLEMLELTQKDTDTAIREVVALLEQLDKELANTLVHEAVGKCDHPPSVTGRHDIALISKVRPNIMVMSKVTPCLTMEVSHKVDPTLSWLIQVGCAEHQALWELGTCLEGKKRGKTEFTTDLMFPVHAIEDTMRGCWIENLPGIQLNHESSIKDLCARECQCNDHRFQFRVCLVNEHHDPVSSVVCSAPFLLSPYTTGKSVDQYVFKQAQKARKITSHIREHEIQERVHTTRIFLMEERKHILPKLKAVSPNSMLTSFGVSEFAKVEISGQFFHRPTVVRIDSDFDDADILKQSVVSSTSSVCASVKIPPFTGSWMLKVRNFDDPNLASEEFLWLHFVDHADAMVESVSPYDCEDAGGIWALAPIFTLEPIDFVKEDEKRDEILQRYKEMCKTKFSGISQVNAFVDSNLFHYHIMNGYTHTVAAMLNSVDLPNKHGLKMKFGAVPAMLSLLSENPCTVILCLVLYFYEQREFSHAEFKRFLAYILYADRTIPLHPHMMLDFLETEIDFDARVRLRKATIIFSENFLCGDDGLDLSGGDDCSPYHSEDEDDCASTSDEDYQEPATKIPKAIPASSGGTPLKICIKLEQPKDGGFAHIVPPPPVLCAQPESETQACEWDNCIVCERDSPIMLQTQNPTWAAIMRVVFFSFIRIFPDTEYWKVRQAYKFIEDHWDKLCPGKSQGIGAWRKQLQDALSHNKQYFISGMHIYGQKGYWGLKQIIDPWAITDEVDFPKRAYHHQPRRGRPPKTKKKLLHKHKNKKRKLT